jgi:hypothetical protein
MTNDEFIKCREELEAHCKSTLFAKEKEYSDGVDRLVQFKSVASFRNISAMDALAGMMVKHESSIHQMCKNGNEGVLYTYDQWLEKIGDLRNYCDLLWATVSEHSKEAL